MSKGRLASRRRLCTVSRCSVASGEIRVSPCLAARGWGGGIRADAVADPGGSLVGGTEGSSHRPVPQAVRVTQGLASSMRRLLRGEGTPAVAARLWARSTLDRAESIQFAPAVAPRPPREGSARPLLESLYTADNSGFNMRTMGECSPMGQDLMGRLRKSGLHLERSFLWERLNSRCRGECRLA